MTLGLASAASAGGGPNGTYVSFDVVGGYTCHTYWLTTGSGLIHEWRTGEINCPAFGGEESLHLVFKPITKFAAADCDDAPYLGTIQWTYNPAQYTDLGGDEGQLADFLQNSATYWVCFYSWNE
jgi:hypothetical protein